MSDRHFKAPFVKLYIHIISVIIWMIVNLIIQSWKNIVHSVYHSRIYFRVRQIFAIFAVCSQSAKICTREIFVTRVPQIGGLWMFSLLLLDYGTAALLQAGQRPPS